MSKIGIMGGTFNPVHNAHLIIAENALEEYGLDKIMFLPNAMPPHKEMDFYISPQARLELVEAAISDNDKFFLSDFEIAKGGKSYTVDTLNAFKEIYKGDELYFIIGGDSLRDFHKWYCPEEIAKLCTFLVYPRENIDIKEHMLELSKTYDAKIFEIHAPRFDISSSMIRQRISEGKSIKYLVPQRVLDKIYENKYYIE